MVSLKRGFKGIVLYKHQPIFVSHMSNPELLQKTDSLYSFSHYPVPWEGDEDQLDFLFKVGIELFNIAAFPGSIYLYLSYENDQWHCSVADKRSCERLSQQ